MHSVHATVQIDRLASQLCRKLGSFGSVGRWHPLLARMESAGDASKVTWSARFDWTSGSGSHAVEAIQPFLSTGLNSLRERYGSLR